MYACTVNLHLCSIKMPAGKRCINPMAKQAANSSHTSSPSKITENKHVFKK